MRFDQKNVLRGTLLIAVIGLVGALAFAQNDSTDTSDATSSSSNKGLAVINAVGNATAAVATSCANIVCPATDDCSYTTLSGTAKGFNRFGGGLGSAQMIACISTDETNALPNGNDGTLCAPSSGIAVITGTKSTVALNMAGQSCTVPGTSATGFQVFNQTWVITSSTNTKAGRGSGSFTAFGNTTTGDGSFTIVGNFSKGGISPTSTPSSTASSTSSSTGSSTPSGSPTGSGSPTPSGSPTIVRR